MRDWLSWGRIAAGLADAGLDRLGARRCAVKGHTWRPIGAIVLREDGGVEELPRGVMQRCRRCGAERATPTGEDPDRGIGARASDE